jgi:hypothetical protein
MSHPIPNLARNQPVRNYFERSTDKVMKDDNETLGGNSGNLNNITGDPETDGVADLEPEKRNELSLSESEMEAGLGLNPFERPTPVEEARKDHPHFLSTSDESEREK